MPHLFKTHLFPPFISGPFFLLNFHSHVAHTPILPTRRTKPMLPVCHTPDLCPPTRFPQFSRAVVILHVACCIVQRCWCGAEEEEGDDGVLATRRSLSAIVFPPRRGEEEPLLGGGSAWGEGGDGGLISEGGLIWRESALSARSDGSGGLWKRTGAGGLDGEADGLYPE